MSMHIANYENGKYQPIWTKNGKAQLITDGYENKQVEMRLEHFFDKEGNIVLTLHDLTSKYAPGTTWEEGYVAKGCWIINAYMKIEEKFYEMKGLYYEISDLIGKQEIVIEGGGKPCIYIKSHTGEINKLITDKDLKKVKFNNGKII